MLFGDAFSSIGNDGGDIFFALIKAHRYFATFRRVVDGIGYEIGYYLINPLFVSVNKNFGVF